VNIFSKNAPWLDSKKRMTTNPANKGIDVQHV
jgi:hypothetical protein